jgi:DNA repair exonuclease SbcCD ATPase subunit
MECLAYPCVIQEAHNVVINAIPHQDFSDDVSARDHDIIRLKSQVKLLNKQMKSVVRNVKDREHQVVQLKENIKKVRTEMKEMSRDIITKEKAMRNNINFAENIAHAFRQVASKCEEYGFITVENLTREQLEKIGEGVGAKAVLQFKTHPITADGKALKQTAAHDHMNKLEDDKKKLKEICLKLVNQNEELKQENEELKKNKSPVIA